MILVLRILINMPNFDTLIKKQQIFLENERIKEKNK